MVDHDRRSTLLDSYENAAVIVSGIDPEDLGNPTPCRRYDVARLVDHIVEAGRRAAALGRGQTPPSGDDSPHVGLSDAPGQLRQAAEEAAPGMGRRLQVVFEVHHVLWGEESTGPPSSNKYPAELAAHAWDLARATGQIHRVGPLHRRHGTRGGAGHDQTRVPRHSRTRISVRRGGTATSGRRRLGPPRRFPGTRPASTAEPVGMRRRGVSQSLAART